MKILTLFLTLVILGSSLTSVYASSPTTVTITQPSSGAVFNEGNIVTVSMVSTDQYGVTQNPNWTLTSSIGGSFTTPTKSGSVWTSSWTTPNVASNNAVITAYDGSSSASVTVSVIENCNPIINSCSGIVSTPTNSTTTNPTTPKLCVLNCLPKFQSVSTPLYYFPVVVLGVIGVLSLGFFYQKKRRGFEDEDAGLSETERLQKELDKLGFE